MAYLKALGVLIKKVTPTKKSSYERSQEDPAKVKAKKPRLYDPKTGEYLNDKIMKVIEDVRSGKEPTYEIGSMEEFKAWCESL